MSEIGCFCLSRLVRWDMRTPEGIAQTMSSPSVLTYQPGRLHNYDTKQAFRCIATSGKTLAEQGVLPLLFASRAEAVLR